MWRVDLGLAIAARLAAQQGASLHFLRPELGGFVVEVHFPLQTR